MSKVFFVGCGPGDPDLITVKAKKILQRAKVVVYSGSLIPDEILKICKRAEMHNAAPLVREEILEILYKGARNNLATVRLHDGDPSIYGAIREQIDELAKRGVDSQVIPGVTAFLASAAALGTQLTLPGVTQTIIITRAESRTRVPRREQIPALASHGATMVFYLSVHLLAKITRQAIQAGYPRSTPAAVIYRAGWPDQKIVTGTISDITRKTRDEKITKTAVIIIGDVVNPSSYEHSRLYDKTFSHGYRRAVASRAGDTGSKGVRDTGSVKDAGDTAGAERSGGSDTGRTTKRKNKA